MEKEIEAFKFKMYSIRVFAMWTFNCFPICIKKKFLHPEYIWMNKKMHTQTKQKIAKNLQSHYC